MRNAFRFLAWLGPVIAPLLAATSPSVLAADRDKDLFIRPDEQRSVVFASIDAGRSIFFSAGAKQTLVGPLDRTGFVVMEANGTGLTRERYGPLDLPALRFTTQSSVLIGHQWNGDGLFLAAFVGPELLHEQLTVASHVNAFAEPRFGPRAQIELWANPTRDTMVTATLVGSSARGSLWARGSTGYRVTGDVYAGPEVTSYVTESYRETKVGAHLTGLNWGIVQGRLSAGWAMSNDNRPGSPYLGLSAWIRM